jgi:hypothetical protein
MVSHKYHFTDDYFHCHCTNNIQNVLETNSFRNAVIIILYSEDGKCPCKCDNIHGNEPSGFMKRMEFLDSQTNRFSRKDLLCTEISFLNRL